MVRVALPSADGCGPHRLAALGKGEGRGQLDALQLFRDKADEGASVIASLHDVNLSVRYADRCLLLYGDGRWDLGDTSEILDSARLSQLYGTPMEAVNWRSTRLYVASGNVAS